MPLCSPTLPVAAWREAGLMRIVGLALGAALLGATVCSTLSARGASPAGAQGTVPTAADAPNADGASLQPLSAEVWRFPAAGVKEPVARQAAQVGDVVTLTSSARSFASSEWWHAILIRRPAITAAEALPPEDGSGLNETLPVWNHEGWGNPHRESYDPALLGRPLVDIGRREPFFHLVPAGQQESVRTFDLVLDAPGDWLFEAVVLDADGATVAAAPRVTVTVNNPPLAGDPASMTYPFGSPDRAVGVFWNAGQAHRLWTSWRADHQSAYGLTWAVNWKLMWQPSPYFRLQDGRWVLPDPMAESPWNPLWSAHQVYAIVPDGRGGSRLSHDLTSRAFAEQAALRLMDVGVDFVTIDYSNQFLEETEAVLPAMTNLANAFATTGRRAHSRQGVRLSALLPIVVDSGDWAANGGFIPAAIARFNAKLTTLYERFARSESAWFHLADEGGERRPLLMLWIGATGAGDPDGKLPVEQLRQLKLADGRLMIDVFTIRWVGAILSGNPRFASDSAFQVEGPGGTVAGRFFKPGIWSYREHATVGAALAARPTTAGRITSGAAAAVEMVTIQPNTFSRDRFGREWQENWPPGAGFHYETLASPGPIRLTEYGRLWENSLSAARALQPKILMTIWAEFGSENDESRPEMTVTVMDNNKYGTHFGDALRQAVRQFKYREPESWIHSITHADETYALAEISPLEWKVFRAGDRIRLQGWVTPNVETAYAGGEVKVYVDDVLRGTATLGGGLDGGTRWTYDLATAGLEEGQHEIKVIADDGVGGTFQAGYQFRGDVPRNVLPLHLYSAKPPASPRER